MNTVTTSGNTFANNQPLAGIVFRKNNPHSDAPKKRKPKAK